MPNLKERALLVKMERKQFSSKVRDKNATQVVNEEFHAHDSGDFYKKLFNKNPRLKEISRVMANVYQYHNDNTWPWLAGGWGIIPNENAEKYIDEINRHKAQLESALAAFEPDYYHAIDEDVGRLQGLANRNDYPSFADFKNTWQINVQFLPVPDRGDFRTELPETIKAGVDSVTQESLEAGRKELLKRMQVFLSRIINQCTKDKGRIHDSLFENVTDLAEVMKAVNVHEDPQVEEWSDKLLSTLEGFTSYQLRTSEEMKKAFAQKAQALMDELGLEVEQEKSVI